MITAPRPTAKPSGGGSRRANALSSGHLLDEYRIEAILGAGGFGVTYKALDTHLEAWVAIKEYFPVEWSFRDADGVTVHPNTQGQTSALEGQESDYHWGLERFLDEARVLARIQHPQVVRVKRYFRAHGTAYIVMDYEDGEPLSAVLRDDETLDETQIRGLLEDILPALQAVHEQGYLHRDIKPANLYLRAADHRVMLIDFGAARAALGRHSRSVTSLVTPGYSPPEQYTTRNDRYGTWTDVYALGAVLYRCAIGRVPMEAAERLLDDQMAPATQAGMGRYSRNLLRVIDQALAVRPEQRLRTVAEMQVALRGASDENSDETVILTPLLTRPGAAAREREAGLPRLTRRPAVPADERGFDPSGLLEITQPHDGEPPPAETRPAVVRRLNKGEGAQRRPSLGLLIGGGAAAALAAALVWFWPLTPEPKPAPPRHDLYQPGPPAARSADGERTIDEQALPGSSAASPADFAPREATVDAGSAESPAVVEPFLASPPEVAVDSPALPEPPVPGMAASEGDSVVAEPDAAASETARDVDPAPSLEAEDALAQPAADPPDRDAAATTETPAEPVAAGVVGETASAPAAVPARPRSGATSEPVARRPPPRGTTTPQSRAQKTGRDRVESRPIVVTPPEWKNRSRAQAPRNPWQPPTDTGFNQK